MIEDFCKFFRDIEADPFAKIKGLTVRDLWKAKEHIMGCDTCYNISERVLARAPKEDVGPSFGVN